MKRIVKQYKYQCLNDAREILKSIGLPERLYNPRCVMTFAACAEMKANDKKWRNASEEYHGTHEIIEFINKEFPCKAGLDTYGYQENSRETFRKNTLKEWIHAGLMEAKTGLATNDKDNSYRFTFRFASLLRTYGTAQWEDSLERFMENYTTYTEILKQEKQ